MHGARSTTQSSSRGSVSMSELDALLEPTGGRPSVQAGQYEPKAPIRPSTQGYQLRETVTKQELDDIIGVTPRKDAPAKKAALTPEQIEQERLVREEAEKCANETPEETALRHKFEEIKRRDDALIEKAQAIEREERKRKAEAAAKVAETNAARLSKGMFPACSYHRRY
jgi:hypothetical protein